MRTILSYVYTYKSPAVIALLLMLVELAVELLQPLLMGRIIDEGILNQDFTYVSVWGSVLIGLSLLAFTAGITNSFFAAKASQGVGFDLRRDLFKKVQRFTNENFQSFSTPGLITRMTNDVTQIQNLLFMFVRIALRAPLFIIFAMVMAFSINVKLAAILVVTVPALLLFLIWVLSKGIRLFKDVQNKLDRVNTVIRENLTGIRLIKGFNRGSYEESRFQQVNESLMDKNKRALWLMELAMPTIMLGMNIVILVVIWAGAAQLQNGGARPGEVVAMVNYATRIMFTFSAFTFLILVFSRGNASAGRLSDVLQERTPAYLEKQGKDVKLSGSIRFEEAGFAHHSVDVLKGISFEASGGDTVGIIGETGAGKTALLNLIPRLYEKKSGKIYLDNWEISEIDVKSLRQQISLVPQEVHLFSGSVKENIAWGKEDATEKEIVQAAKAAQIHNFIRTLPNGYDTRLAQKGVTFSGGQKQRISIARALIREPKILILDDSTSALDAQTEERLLKALKELQCTVFMVAQKISSLKAADTILVLKKGEIIARGSHEELLMNSETYQEVYQSQSQKEDVSGHG
ncbi:ABC transporter ATP-binding protein/permease [Halobacillus salinarum]|uniref:ABC transporter ATP-binding protein/permease n=1 Tax=Halobacillus salinarum TaxID=2932257 RepID=A0ABY4EM93_9BACI|nr:ABC transporter ATP-binding protein [Halobacillus salinarum]UOQ45117.1 ABC transporter ATP-binding protein/permease [Halobacillus salinarum]